MSSSDFGKTVGAAVLTAPVLSGVGSIGNRLVRKREGGSVASTAAPLPRDQARR